tara:strand:- start:102 stop:218 length:117 start_codon:yes stop_codon:yes gene_type:complete
MEIQHIGSAREFANCTRFNKRWRKEKRSEKEKADSPYP